MTADCTDIYVDFKLRPDVEDLPNMSRSDLEVCIKLYMEGPKFRAA